MSLDLDKYRSCLYDIKKRVEVIQTFIKGIKTTGYLVTNVELVALQFRKIIELIALSSMVANKEEYAKQREKFDKDWNARLIFQDLERLNPNFYPAPSKQIEKQNKKGQRFYELEPIKEGFLTKKEAIKIYDKCSTVLHADNPFANEKEWEEIWKLFPDWVSKVIILLSHHSIVLINRNMVVGIMENPDDKLPKALSFGYVGKSSEISEEDIHDY